MRRGQVMGKEGVLECGWAVSDAMRLTQFRLFCPPRFAPTRFAPFCPRAQYGPSICGTWSDGNMSTHAASILFRWRLTNWLRKKSSSVSFFRSLPNHSGPPVSRLHTTVRNWSLLALVDLIDTHLPQRWFPPLLWEPFRLSIEQWAPQCKIVYDKFHVLQHANDAIDEVRRAEFFRQAP